MDYDQDLKKAMGWNRINLELVGIWPNLTLSKEQLPNYRPLIICVWIALFLTLPQSVNLFMLDGDLALITDNLCLANIPATNAIIKMIITWYHREDLRLLVKSFYVDWYSSKTEEERTIMMNRAKITQYISIWCTLLAHPMNAVYISLRTFAIVTIDRSNEMQDRLLLFSAYFPYNVRPPLVLLLTNIGQAFACCLGTFLYTSIDIFIAMLVLHACGQFENLKRRLEGLMGEKNGTRSMDDIRKELRSIVERHEHLNWVATMIDKCFSQLLLIQLVLCTIEICFQGFMFFNYVYICRRLRTDCTLRSLRFVLACTCVIFVQVYFQLSKRACAKKEAEVLNGRIVFSYRKRTPAMVSMDVQRDLKYVYSWNYYTMKFMGIWPEERRWNQPSNYLVLIPVFMMLCFVCVPQTANLPRIWNNLYLIVENLSMGNITITISLIKMTIFWTKGKSLKFLLKCMAEDWSEKMSVNDRKTMRNIARITRITIIRSTLMCIILVILYSFLRFFTVKYSGTRLLFRGYFPYDLDVSPSYELTICGQLIGAFYAAMSYTAVDTFVAMLVFHVCGQLSILSKDIRNLPSHGKTDMQVKLGRVVRKHKYLNTFVEKIENCFNVMLLLQMLGCTVQLCFQCFQVIVVGKTISFLERNVFLRKSMHDVSRLTNVILLLVDRRRKERVRDIATYLPVPLRQLLMLQLYLYCYVGERLLIESTELANAAYNCKWYNLSAKNAKLLVIIIQRARLPMRITAGKFCTLTLMLYSDILKRSMGYISVLYATKNK
ncbi:LOW QUALITY PROTEIN: uncharacterized protein LOC143342062 [Colletes latitarsis]|uniref:LOW QUALITY PROTEIN: uncharacterized protein LOC143342062 n=1 Tax=Colletes latitarsis TaxID=2605962 RepID=UPI0040359E84